MALGAAAGACGSSGGGGEPTEAGAAPPEDASPVEDRAAPPADAGSDAPDAAPDAGPGFCASLSPAPKFCDDFDDGDLADDWTVSTARAGFSRLLLDTAEVKSAPASLRAESNAIASVGDSANASLRKTVLVASSHIRLAWSAKLPVTSITTGAVAICGVDVALNRFYTLWLRDEDAASPSASLVEEIDGAVTARHVLGQPPPAGAWTRIAVDLDLANGRASVSFDGAKALDSVAITPGAGSEVTVRLGNVYVKGPQPKFVGNYDDVVLDW
jgi:hypothetical protein